MFTNAGHTIDAVVRHGARCVCRRPAHPADALGRPATMASAVWLVASFPELERPGASAHRAQRGFARGNPRDAPLWLLGVVLVLGLLAISAVRWLGGALTLLGSMRHAGVRAWLQLAVIATSSLLLFAIIVRVIGSWLGAGRYNRWMRPAYLLSDWIIEPIRRRLPAFGPIDLSPFVAYILILVLRDSCSGAVMPQLSRLRGRTAHAPCPAAPSAPSWRDGGDAIKVRVAAPPSLERRTSG
jgi:uncharacterized protein YggT (Ycf19 family)